VTSEEEEDQNLIEGHDNVASRNIANDVRDQT
jgi:hypothetical protein